MKCFMEFVIMKGLNTGEKIRLLIPPPEEEFEAEYYGELIVHLAVTQGYLSEAKDSVFASFGIDMANVVCFLEQNGVDPKNEVYQYLSDIRQRYLFEKRREKIEKWGPLLARGNSRLAI